MTEDWRSEPDVWPTGFWYVCVENVAVVNGALETTTSFKVSCVDVWLVGLAISRTTCGFWTGKTGVRREFRWGTRLRKILSSSLVGG